jgi:hypothetical protein
MSFISQVLLVLARHTRAADFQSLNLGPKGTGGGKQAEGLPSIADRSLSINQLL